MTANRKRTLAILLTFLLIFAVVPATALGASAWAPNTSYHVGDIVTYGGSTYSCLQAHTSLTGWEPPNVPALWKLESGGGTADTQAPTVPANLKVTATTTSSISLSWTASTDNVGVAGYDVYKGTTLAGTVAGTTFTASGLTAGTSYSFTVKAKDAAGNASAASTAVTGTTQTTSSDTQAPTAPANLSSSALTSNSVTLSWTASSDNVGVTGYTIYQGTTSVGASAGTTFTVTGLAANTTYSFTVKASDAAGNSSAASAALSVKTQAGSGGLTGAKIVTYYPEWAVYGRGFKVPDIDASKVNVINYAFADICWNGVHGNSDPTGPNPQTWACADETGNISVPNGTIVQGDPWADTGMSYTGDTWDMPIKGSFNQLVKLKQANPNVKTIISVGGWTWSNRFSDVAADATVRSNFAKSAVSFIKKYQFDGVDLDWEYPVSGGLAGNSYRTADKQNYILLLQAIRSELDTAGAADGKHYYLTIAAGAGPSYITNNQLSSMASILDWVNLMSYDFHGSWEAKSGQNAPLYFDPADSSSDPVNFNVDKAVTSFLAAGVPASKLVLGLPYYGRGWAGCANVNGGQYQTCSGVSQTGTWEKGSYDFNDLQANYINKNGYTRYWNSVTKTPYLYNPSGGTYISYDDEQSIQAKVDYIKSKGLGGAMSWEVTGDRNKTLQTIVKQGLLP
ncbi:glycosyl hydrolase family 18 protein [Paenibacillus sp. GCM10027628]|uniref:glycosyl hydrolase family 18 protein n=1 Tax=Paenibacillus sp. GCM10027628 TaxID=3273413 RepID=UPI0036255F47